MGQMMSESFRDRWRARPIGNTTAGTIADAAVANMRRRLDDPETSIDTRNRLQFVIDNVEADNVYHVHGLIYAYHAGLVDVRGVR